MTACAQPRLAVPTGPHLHLLPSISPPARRHLCASLFEAVCCFCACSCLCASITLGSNRSRSRYPHQSRRCRAPLGSSFTPCKSSSAQAHGPAAAPCNCLHTCPIYRPHQASLTTLHLLDLTLNCSSSHCRGSWLPAPLTHRLVGKSLLLTGTPAVA